MRLSGGERGAFLPEVRGAGSGATAGVCGVSHSANGAGFDVAGAAAFTHAGDSVVCLWSLPPGVRVGRHHRPASVVGAPVQPLWVDVERELPRVVLAALDQRPGSFGPALCGSNGGARVSGRLQPARTQVLGTRACHR